LKDTLSSAARDYANPKFRVSAIVPRLHQALTISQGFFDLGCERRGFSATVAKKNGGCHHLLVLSRIMRLFAKKQFMLAGIKGQAKTKECGSPIKTSDELGKIER